MNRTPTPPPPLPLFAAERMEIARHAGEEAMTACADKAGDDFASKAREFAIKYLTTHLRASGEVVTDAAKAAGIVPPSNDRAFGNVYKKLANDGVIVFDGYTERYKGHGTGGAKVWKIAAKARGAA